MIKKFITPDFLKPGDHVALVSPAGFIADSKVFGLAEKLLKSWELKPVLGKNALNKHGIYSGTDEERLFDLQEVLNDPKIKAIWALRGGYGVVRILPELNFDAFIKNPKWLIGFSDITALHNQFHKLGYKSMHALMPVQLSNQNNEIKRAVSSLQDALFGNDLENIIPASDYNRMGSAKGVLVGGNLSILQSLLGTRYQIKTKDKIVFIEEIGESLYRIDRLLQSLKLSGFFKDIKALIVGGFTDIPEDDIPYGKTYQEIILDIVKDVDCPVLFDVPAGHIDDNRTLILGHEAIVKVGEFVSCVRFEQS